MRQQLRDQLLSELFISSEDHNSENLKNHINDLLRYRFLKLFHLTEGSVTTQDFDKENLKTIPVEKEVGFMLDQKHPDLFLENLFYHLQRNQLHIPPSLLPRLLTSFKSFPGEWHRIFRHHPNLVLALAHSNHDWEYTKKAFDPESGFMIGSPLFYESLIHRLRIYPTDTADFIRNSFPSASPHHQIRLLEVISQDRHPDTQTFFISLFKGHRKPIRITALKTMIRQKHPEVYAPILKMLLSDNYDAKEIRRLYPDFWKDFFSFSGFTDKESALLSVVDPADYPVVPDKNKIRKEAILQAALLHRSQRVLTEELVLHPENNSSSEIIKNLSSSSAIQVVQSLYLDQNRPLDQIFFDLLKRIKPHINENMTTQLWKRVTAHRADFPFYFDSYPLEVWALRIHPNLINKIWKDPDLQTTEPMIQTFRDILKYRLAFLKKCYQQS